jgi:hypothetical protein
VDAPPPGSGSGRPDTGVGHYLRDLVYGAPDGITTMAIVAGAVSAVERFAVGAAAGGAAYVVGALANRFVGGR